MKLNIRDIGLILCFGFVFGLMIVYQMRSVISGGAFILLITFVGLICFLSNVRHRVNSIFLPALLLTIIMIINTLLGDKTHVDNLVNTILRLALWFSILNIGSHYNREDSNNRIVMVWVIIYSAVSLFLESKNFFSDYSAVNKFYEVTTLYYLLLIIPFVLCIKNSLIRIISILLIGIFCIMSFKRTILLTLVLLVFSWVVLLPRKDNKAKRFSVLACFLLVATFVLILNFDTILPIMKIWGVRFASSGNSTVLGERGLTYNSVFSLMSKSSVIEWLFGHGYDTVSIASSTGFSAHNDFLEILYDYGIFALGLYIGIIGILIKHYFKYRKSDKTIKGNNNTNNEYSLNSFALLSSIIIVVFAGMFSHLITYPTHFMLISLFWGWILPKNTVLHKKER